MEFRPKRSDKKADEHLNKRSQTTRYDSLIRSTRLFDSSGFHDKCPCCYRPDGVLFLTTGLPAGNQTIQFPAAVKPNSRPLDRP